jgi:hypothetical protein
MHLRPSIQDYRVAYKVCIVEDSSWKRAKSVATGFDFKNGVALPTEGILYAGAPLTGMAADKAFAYLGVRASLLGVSRSREQASADSEVVQRRRRCPAPCLAAEKEHIFTATRDITLMITGKARHHKHRLGQM